MARLYHQPYMTGGMGMMGGYKKASPDPVTYASCAYDGDTTQTAPGYLNQFQDMYGTTLTRITDTATFGSAARHWLAYTKTPVECGGRYGTYVTLTAIEPPWLLRGPKQGSPMVFVSAGTNGDSEQYPSQIYDGRVYNCNIATAQFRYSDQLTGVRTLIRDFRPTYQTIRIKNGEACPSNDENIWSILVKNAASGSSGTWFVLIYRVSDNTILQTYNTNHATSTSNPSQIDHVMMSQDGKYWALGVVAGGSVNGLTQGYHSFRVSDGQYMGLITNNQNHGDAAVLEDGITQVLVGHNNAGDIVYRRFDCAEPMQVLLAGFLDKSSWAKWVSARNIDRPGYVYIGNTEFNEAPAKNPFDDNIIAVRIANGEIERWCRGQGSGADSGSFERYWVPSADGKRLYVTLPAVFRTNNPPRDTAQETYLCQYMPSGT